MSSERTGGSSIGKMLHDMNEFLFVKNKKASSVVSIFLVVGLTFLVFSYEANAQKGNMLGADDIRDLFDKVFGGPDNVDFPEISGFVEYSAQISSSESLNENGNTEFEIENSKDRVVSSIDVIVTWQDEQDTPGRPRIRRYSNEPDEFTVEVTAPNGTSLDSKTATNANNGAGSISLKIQLDRSQMKENFEELNGYTVTMTMGVAGDWIPVVSVIGAMDIQDTGNSFDIEINYNFLAEEEK